MDTPSCISSATKWRRRCLGSPLFRFQIVKGGHLKQQRIAWFVLTLALTFPEPSNIKLTKNSMAWGSDHCGFTTSSLQLHQEHPVKRCEMHGCADIKTHLWNRANGANELQSCLPQKLLVSISAPRRRGASVAETLPSRFAFSTAFGGVWHRWFCCWGQEWAGRKVELGQVHFEAAVKDQMVLQAVSAWFLRSLFVVN